MGDQFRQRQDAGILAMLAVDGVGDGFDSLRGAQEPDVHLFLGVDHGHLLAGAKIGDGLLPALRGNFKSHAVAGSAAVQSQHQPRLFRRAAMHVGIDAEAAVIAPDQRRGAADIVKPRPPHQRTIAKNPELPHDRLL